ncbi:hypothetical protein [Actinophytocola oryzae]|uniref:DUF732 domain-containing protein n=1 Tax=Actinophytocola oryzae TaxID=502181 RepID=A0A4R7VVX4_9PSEU|nr:hypothetical protein [Actinophytocola oryzae]TDV54183.1 hypothetical protein CLV71_104654 [Actinophytocola oryzae]
MVRLVSTVIAGSALLVVVTACGTQSTASSPSTTVDIQSVEEAAGIPPKPDATTKQAYIAELVAIDPDIVHGKEDKAVSRGRDQCSSVKQWPNDQTKLVDLTEQRFTSPDHPEGFGPEKSAQMLAVVRKYLCPTY